MAVPTKNNVPLTDTEVAATKPFTTAKLTQMRDSIVHLSEWLGDGFTAAIDHNHDGVNSALVEGAQLVKIGNPVVASDDLEAVVTGFSTDYEEFWIKIWGVKPITTDTGHRMQFSSDGGSSFISSNYRFPSAAQSFVEIMEQAGIGDSMTSAFATGFGVVRLWRPMVAAERTFGVVETMWRSHSSSELAKGIFEQLLYNATGAIDAVRFYQESGNVDLGTYQLYGVKP